MDGCWVEVAAVAVTMTCSGGGTTGSSGRHGQRARGVGRRCVPGRTVRHATCYVK